MWLNALEMQKAGYVFKVPFWRGLNLQDQFRQCTHWQRVDKGVDGFTTVMTLKKWERTFNITISRKCVMHPNSKISTILRNAVCFFRINVCY